MSEPMTEAKAREVLGNKITAIDCLHDQENYLHWDGGKCAMMDGQFDADELEAIAWWMRNK